MSYAASTGVAAAVNRYRISGFLAFGILTILWPAWCLRLEADTVAAEMDAGAHSPPGQPSTLPGTSSIRAGTNNLPRVHDPSTVVRCENEYWCFSTGTGILSRRSKDLVRWTAGPPVFATIPAWVQEVVPGHKGHFWAPDILRLRDRYLLYYSVSTWGKNTSAIALATNPTLNPDDARFRWSDEGMVFRSWATNDFNTIDPSVCLDREGRLWLAFGSFWSGIKMVELDPVTGKRCAGAKPIYALANYPQIEAPTLVARQEYYYLFVNWGFCCRGLDSTYSILVGRSRQITGPYLDEEGRDLLDGGGYPFLQSADRFVGPGHAAVFSEGPQSLLSYHFYDGQRRGAPTLAVRQLSWNTNGWPVAGKMISPVVENQ